MAKFPPGVVGAIFFGPLPLASLSVRPWGGGIDFVSLLYVFPRGGSRGWGQPPPPFLIIWGRGYFSILIGNMFMRTKCQSKIRSKKCIHGCGAHFRCTINFHNPAAQNYIIIPSPLPKIAWSPRGLPSLLVKK